MTTREHCERRAKALMAERNPLDPTIADIASLAMPSINRFTPTARGRKTLTNNLKDGYGIRANSVLKNGLMSGMSNPSRPWFKTKVPDTDLMKYWAVKAWLAQVDKIMADFMNATNFYGALKAGYGEIGLFGTEACMAVEHWREGMVCHPMTFGEYWLGCDETRTPTQMLRHLPLTTDQVVALFVAGPDRRTMNWGKVDPQVKTAWDNSNYNNTFNFMQLVEPNLEYDRSRYDAQGKPWRSTIWQAGCTLDPVEQTGFNSKPFWAARWETESSDTYGTGPGWNALPDLKELQFQNKRRGDATDMCIKPPLVGPANVKIKLTPGSLTAAANVDKDQLFAAYTVDYRTIEVVRADITEIRNSIDSHFYVDLFMAISQMDGVQPRNNEEIFSRNEEKLSQLGPVIENVNKEKLGVAIDRVFDICMRRGMFPDPPEEIQGMPVEVDFISILAQAQRAVGLTSTERTLGVIGNMAGVFPDAADNVDSDAVIVDYMERSGFPMAGIRDPKKRDAMRAQRAQEIAAQQAKESMPAMQQGAQAAQILSQTDVRGQPLLEALTGG